jgi:hypothetical protein
MSKQSWQETMWWDTVDGTAIANSTAEALFFNNRTVPAGYLQDGRAMRITAMGRYSSTGTPTLRIRIRLGGLAGTVIWDSGTITVGSGVTNAMWKLTVHIQNRSNGTSGTVLAMGDITIGSGLATTVGNATGSAATGVMGAAGVLTPAATTIDVTADQSLSITGQWSAASASNTAQGIINHGESLN